MPPELTGSKDVLKEKRVAKKQVRALNKDGNS